METLWFMITVLGPVLLAAALIYAIVTNRRRSAAERRASERGARDLREQLDREK